MQSHPLYRLSRKTILNTLLGIQDRCFSRERSPSERSPPREGRSRPGNSPLWLKLNRQIQQQTRWQTPATTCEAHHNSVADLESAFIGQEFPAWPFSAKPKDSFHFQLPVPEIAWFMDEVKVCYYHKLSDPFTAFQVPPWVFSSFSPSPFLVSGQNHWPQDLHRWQIYTSHLLYTSHGFYL